MLVEKHYITLRYASTDDNEDRRCIEWHKNSHRLCVPESRYSLYMYKRDHRAPAPSDGGQPTALVMNSSVDSYHYYFYQVLIQKFLEIIHKSVNRRLSAATPQLKPIIQQA
jgi:hypothetical protein